MKQLKLKPEEELDAFFQHLYELREQFQKIWEEISDRRIIDILIENLIPGYIIVRLHHARDIEGIALYKAELAMLQIWMFTIQIRAQKCKLATASSPAQA